MLLPILLSMFLALERNFDFNQNTVLFHALPGLLRPGARLSKLRSSRRNYNAHAWKFSTLVAPSLGMDAYATGHDNLCNSPGLESYTTPI